MTKHGVLTKEGLLTIQGNAWQLVDNFQSNEQANPNRITDLMRIGIDNGLTHLWVHAEADSDPLIPLVITKGRFEGDIDGWHIYAGHCQGTHIQSVYGWTLPKGNGIFVIFPHYSAWGKGRGDKRGWASVASPKQLLVTIAYLEKKLGIGLKASPGGTGWELHKKIHPEWAKEAPSMKMLEQHFRASAGPDLTTQRTYEPSEGRYLHKIDKNSAYLHSCVFDALYGVGDPMPSTDGREFDGKSPGAWYCTITPLEMILPGYEEGTYWLSTPAIRLMRKSGYEVEIHQGWFWEWRGKNDPKPSQCHQVMARWGQFIWDMRQFFTSTNDPQYRREDCRKFAREAMKQIAVETVGLSGYRFNQDEITDKRRPDIRAQTISRTYELMYWNIVKFYEQTELMPVMCYADALYYVSDSAELPHQDVFLSRKDQLGGYKYEGRIEITPDVIQYLNNERLNVSSKLEFFNKIGWVK